MATRKASEPVVKPDVYEADYDNTVSTGVVEPPPRVVEHRADHWEQDVVVRVATPTDPVEMSVSWPSEDTGEVHTKVVAPPAPDPVSPLKQAEKKDAPVAEVKTG